MKGGQAGNTAVLEIAPRAYRTRGTACRRKAAGDDRGNGGADRRASPATC
jgi:hypothetical protein